MTQLALLPYVIIDRPGNHIHRPRWRGRCTYCGHRVGGYGIIVRETREQPWRIPSEMLMRYLAMRRGA